MSEISNRRRILSVDEDESKNQLSAPSLYCIFALSVILIMVGTFISAHAYVSDHSTDEHMKIEHILRILGPILLGVGGVILLGISILCLVMYKKNKKTRNIDTEELFVVGASSFFDEHLAHRGDMYLENALSSGIDNPSGPTSRDDPIAFLANAVVQERRRKLSKNVPQLHHQSETAETKRNERRKKRKNEQSELSGNHSPAVFSTESFNDNLKQSTNYRIHPMPELRKISDCENLANPNNECNEFWEKESTETSTYRSRTQSLLTARPQFRNEPDTHSFRRLASLNPSAKEAHREELRKRREIQRLKIEKERRNYYPELSPSLSLRRKKKKEKRSLTEQPQIHQLPGYSPDVIDNIIQLADKANFRRSVSFDTSEAFEKSLSRKEEFSNTMRENFDHERQLKIVSRAPRSLSDQSSSDLDEEFARSRKYKQRELAKTRSRRKYTNLKLGKDKFPSENDETPQLSTPPSTLSQRRIGRKGSSQISPQMEQSSEINTTIKKGVHITRGTTEKENTVYQRTESLESERDQTETSHPSQVNLPESSDNGDCSSSDKSSVYSSCSASPAYPPTPLDASLEAVNIMNTLLRPPVPITIPPIKRKSLSVIYSQDEPCDENEEERIMESK